MSTEKELNELGYHRFLTVENLRVGQLVKMKYGNHIYPNPWDLFEVVRIEKGEQFWSGEGVEVKSAVCPCCGYHNKARDNDLKDKLFDAGWFEFVITESL